MKNSYTPAQIRSKTGVFIKYVVLIFMTVISLWPILWVILSGFKTPTEIYVNSFGLPREWLLENYLKVFSSKSLLSGFYNSFVTGFLVLFIGLALGSMVAYVSSRLMKSSLLHSYYAIGIMIPMHSILIPTFLILKQLGLVHTRSGVILSYIAATLPITVFILHGFMKGIPHEIEEAAVIDGCSKARIFGSIILPISKPGLATVLTINALNVWNDYLFSMIIGGNKLYNITVVISNFRGDAENTTDYGLICAALVFSILPLVIIYILLQENVIKGMAEGALKS